MPGYSEDLILIDELYRNTKTVADKKTDENKDADISDEQEDMAGLSTAYFIVRDSAELEGTGMTRDISDVAKGVEIFSSLKSLLDRSSRSSSSNYMTGVVRTLDDYMSQDSVVVLTAPYSRAKRSNGSDSQKEADKKQAADQAFEDVVGKVKEKMLEFKTAADLYVSEVINKSKAWSTAGKHRRAMVKAAAMQMVDQLKLFTEKQELLRNNIEYLLDAAESQRKMSLKLSAHSLVRDLLQEERQKKETEEVDTLAKEIAARVAADENVATKGEHISDFEKVTSLVNMGRTEESKRNFDPAKLYKEYQELRSESPQNFAMTPNGLIQTKMPGVSKVIMDETPDIKDQKAKISLMFYLMTGQDKIPDFIYYFKELPIDRDQGIRPGTMAIHRVFPLNVPEITQGTDVKPEDFIAKIKSQFGEDTLTDVNFMKYVDGEATNQADLAKNDNAIWTDLSKSLSGKGPEDNATQKGIDKMTTIRVRYLALQQALGSFNPK